MFQYIFEELRSSAIQNEVTRKIVIVNQNDYVSTCGATLIRVPSGSFVMGSPESESGHKYFEPQSEVSLTADYFLGMTPVTKQQYAELVDYSPSTFPDSPDDAPIDGVRLDGANRFCELLTIRDRDAGLLPQGWIYRLPTEREWEYACRAGCPEARYGKIDDIAWYRVNSEHSPHAVAQKAPNAWGFYDMLGNVWEACEGWFHIGYKKPAVRGGSYFNTPEFCRAATREGYNGGRYTGFRLCAAEDKPVEVAPAADELPEPDHRPPSIYSVISASDTGLAAKIVAEDPSAVETWDEIPPPVLWCIYNEKPEMLKWLLDHGADIERLDQDYGATPLTCAIVMRQLDSIRLLVERGADTSRATEICEKGMAGGYENVGLDAAGYVAVQALLAELIG